MYCRKNIFIFDRTYNSMKKMKSESVSRSVMDSLRPVNCSLPSSSVHGSLQARILEWLAVSSCRRSSQPRDGTCVSCFGRFFTTEPPGKPNLLTRWSYLQSRNRDTDTDNKHMDTKEKREGKMNWEIEINIYMPQYIKQICNENLLYSSGNSTQGSVVT